MYVLNAYGWKHLLYCTAYILFSNALGNIGITVTLGLMLMLLSVDQAYWKWKEK